MNDIPKKLPKSVDEAVERLIAELSLTDRAMIAGTAEEELIDLQFSLGEYIRKEFGLEKNNDLLESCRSVSQIDQIHVGHAAFTIIVELWKRLQTTFFKTIS